MEETLKGVPRITAKAVGHLMQRYQGMGVRSPGSVVCLFFGGVYRRRPHRLAQGDTSVSSDAALQLRWPISPVRFPLDRFSSAERATPTVAPALCRSSQRLRLLIFRMSRAWVKSWLRASGMQCARCRLRTPVPQAGSRPSSRRTSPRRTQLGVPWRKSVTCSTVRHGHAHHDAAVPSVK